MRGSYESRLERLEQEIAEPTERWAVAYIHDSDTRPADWMQVNGQGPRFDRRADENVGDFQQRVLESLGMADWNVIVVRYVASNGNGGPRLPAGASV